MAKSIDVLCEPVGSGNIARRRFDRIDDASMERPPKLLEQAVVRDLVGERVLEGVDQLREVIRLIDELCSLQSRQPGPEVLIGCGASVFCTLALADNGLQNGKGYVLPHHGSGLEESFVLRGQAVYAGG